MTAITICNDFKVYISIKFQPEWVECLEKTKISIDLGIFLNNFIYLSIFGCAGSLLLHRLLSSCSNQGLLSSCSAWASCCSGFSWCRARALGHMGFRSCGVWPQELQLVGSRATGAAVKAQGLSYPAACGIFPDQGWNPCPLHRQAGSLPLNQQRSPGVFLSFFFFFFSWQQDTTVHSGYKTVKNAREKNGLNLVNQCKNLKDSF